MSYGAKVYKLVKHHITYLMGRYVYIYSVLLTYGTAYFLAAFLIIIQFEN